MKLIGLSYHIYSPPSNYLTSSVKATSPVPPSVFEPIIGEFSLLVMPLSSFMNDVGVKQEVKDLPSSSGLGHT